MRAQTLRVSISYDTYVLTQIELCSQVQAHTKVRTSRFDILEVPASTELVVLFTRNFALSLCLSLRRQWIQFHQIFATQIGSSCTRFQVHVRTLIDEISLFHALNAVL